LSGSFAELEQSANYTAYSIHDGESEQAYSTLRKSSVGPFRQTY